MCVWEGLCDPLDWSSHLVTPSQVPGGCPPEFQFHLAPGTLFSFRPLAVGGTASCLLSSGPSLVSGHLTHSAFFVRLAHTSIRGPCPKNSLPVNHLDQILFLTGTLANQSIKADEHLEIF